MKQAREARGLSLQDLADSTKISIPTLEALERLEYSRLPGGIFSRSFVRAYASAVGVDPETAVTEFLEDHARYEREAATRVKGPQVTADDREFLGRQQRAVRLLRIGLVVAAVISVAVLAYELWVWWPRSEPAEVDAPKESRAFSDQASRARPIPSASAKVRPYRPPHARALPRSGAS